MTLTVPKRIQRKRTKGWRMPEGAIYVGRPTIYGNPFTVADRRESVRRVAQRVLQMVYTKWLDAEVHAHLTIDLEPLRGHDLACWCRLCDLHADGLPLGPYCPDCSPCHADVLLELANA